MPKKDPQAHTDMQKRAQQKRPTNEPQRDMQKRPTKDPHK